MRGRGLETGLHSGQQESATDEINMAEPTKAVLLALIDEIQEQVEARKCGEFEFIESATSSLSACRLSRLPAAPYGGCSSGHRVW